MTDSSVWTQCSFGSRWSGFGMRVASWTHTSSSTFAMRGSCEANYRATAGIATNGVDTHLSGRQSASVAKDAEGRGVGELLAAVAGNVAAVPLVLGFVALGGAVLAGR